MHGKCDVCFNAPDNLLQHPVATLIRSTGQVGGCSHIGLRQFGKDAQEIRTFGTLGHIAAEDQDVGSIGHVRCPCLQLLPVVLNVINRKLAIA